MFRSRLVLGKRHYVGCGLWDQRGYCSCDYTQAFGGPDERGTLLRRVLAFLRII